LSLPNQPHLQDITPQTFQVNTPKQLSQDQTNNTITANPQTTVATNNITRSTTPTMQTHTRGIQHHKSRHKTGLRNYFLIGITAAVLSIVFFAVLLRRR